MEIKCIRCDFLHQNGATKKINYSFSWLHWDLLLFRNRKRRTRKLSATYWVISCPPLHFVPRTKYGGAYLRWEKQFLQTLTQNLFPLWWIRINFRLFIVHTLFTVQSAKTIEKKKTGKWWIPLTFTVMHSVLIMFLFFFFDLLKDIIVVEHYLQWFQFLVPLMCVGRRR